VSQDDLILSLYNITYSWVVELVASFRATPHRKYFQGYVQGYFRQVYLANDKPCKIVGKGKIQLKFQKRNQWLLKEVKHILDLRNKYNFNREVGK
jgi:hypothetical protein